MHDWVISLDATSLYPSIMMTLNISPETYRGIDKDFSVDALLSGKIHLTPPDSQAWGLMDPDLTKQLGVLFRKSLKK